jgi:hypothetical protein
MSFLAKIPGYQLRTIVKVSPIDIWRITAAVGMHAIKRRN